MADKSTDWLGTPVVFFIFNRPDTTQAVFERIRAVCPRQLFVVADGPRPEREDDWARCAAVRTIIEQVDWPCALFTNYADQNMGCGKRISSGLGWVFEQVEAAIILEDDCVPEPDFFPFCEAMLNRYQDDERIIMISGSNMVDDFDIPESYLFSRWYNIWGWATWRRAWQLYDFTMADWPYVSRTRLIEYCYPKDYVSNYLRKGFHMVHAQKMDTWDIQWFFTCMINSGLCIVPRVNLIANIGTTGTHTQNGHGGVRPTAPLNTEELQHPKWVQLHSGYDDALYADRLKPTWKRLLARYTTAVRLRLNRLLSAK